jgi:protein SCO1/2
MRIIRRTALAGLIITALFAGATPAGVASGARAAADETKRVKTPRERMAERNFPNVTLTTQDGKKVKFYDDLIKDKIVLLNFFYVKCQGICPGATANLAKVQKLLGDRVGRDIFMYSITLKPEEDTPAVLNKYAKAYKTKPGWLFLTGDPKDIETLRQSLGFIDRDPVRDANKSNHIGMLRYGNEALQLWAGCPSTLRPGGIVHVIGLVDWPKAEEAKRGGER